MPCHLFIHLCSRLPSFAALLLSVGGTCYLQNGCKWNRFAFSVVVVAPLFLWWVCYWSCVQILLAVYLPGPTDIHPPTPTTSDKVENAMNGSFPCPPLLPLWLCLWVVALFPFMKTTLPTGIRRCSGWIEMAPGQRKFIEWRREIKRNSRTSRPTHMYRADVPKFSRRLRYLMAIWYGLADWDV